MIIFALVLHLTVPEPFPLAKYLSAALWLVTDSLAQTPAACANVQITMR